MPRPAIAGSAVATGKGDDGSTGLLYGGRVSKDDPRTEAYGTIEEDEIFRKDGDR